MDPSKAPIDQHSVDQSIDNKVASNDPVSTGMPVDIDKTVDKYLPKLNKQPWLAVRLKNFLKRLLQQDEINRFISENQHLSHPDFLEKTVDYLGISYTVRNRELDNIPRTGRVVMVSNHPLGAIDGIGLLNLVTSVRKDVKIVVNDILWQLEPLRPYFLQVDNMTGNSSKDNLKAIRTALQNEEAVIFFPAGSVSRLSWQGVRDGQWRAGFLRMARATQSPILPMFVGGKNSRFFYGASLFSKWIGMLMLVREMYNNVFIDIKVRIGKLIPANEIQKLNGVHKNTVKRFKDSVYRIANDKGVLFKTVESIARPEAKEELVAELAKCQCIRDLGDNKKVYLLEDTYDSVILREISRLREITFRAVGEGTGQRRDVDEFDYHYKHLVLWDEQDLEIIGSYRIKDNTEVFTGSLDEQTNSLYTSRLVKYNDNFKTEVLPQSMELGRSFVQAKYWGKRSLDYLWMGIGAYLKHNPQVQYLFGLVSISSSLPLRARSMLSYYHRLYYPDTKHYANHLYPFTIKDKDRREFDPLFKNEHGEQLPIKEAFKVLKSSMNQMQAVIPTLYKQYADLCEPGGVVFSDFGVDEDFANAIDGLVIVDFYQLKNKKYIRYIDAEATQNPNLISNSEK